MIDDGWCNRLLLWVYSFEILNDLCFVGPLLLAIREIQIALLLCEYGDCVSMNKYWSIDGIYSVFIQT